VNKEDIVSITFEEKPPREEAAQQSKSPVSPLGAATAPEPKERLLDEVVVPNTRPEKVMSNVVLEQGKEYIIEASGVFSDWSGKTGGVDAVWCYAEWRYGKHGEIWNQLRIDDKGMTEIAGKTIPYNPKHVYRVRYTGKGKQVEFFLSDAQWSWSGNSGSVTVKIFQE